MREPFARFRISLSLLIVTVMVIRWPRVLAPTHLCQILKQQKNPLTALHLFNTATLRYPSYRHNAPAYAAIIQILASSGRLREMSDVLDQLRRDSCRCPDSLISETIRTYAAAGRPGDAVALYHQLPSFNCIERTESLNAIVQMLAAEGRLQEAVRLIEESGQATDGGKVKVETLNVLIGALCDMDRPDLALEVFGEIRDLCCSPDRETYRLLMRGLCKAGMLHEATHLLYSMFRRISEKGCDADVVVYRTLLETLCVEGRVKEAEDVLEKVLKKGLRVPRLRRSFQKWEITGTSLDEMKCSINEALVTGGVRSTASYCAVIKDLYSEGKIEDGDKLLDEMLQRGFRPKVSTYEAKITALCSEERSEDALKVLEEEMMGGICTPAVSTVNLVLQGLCKERKSALAMSLLGKMDRCGGYRPNKVSYEIVVAGLCSEECFMEARNLLEKMLLKRHLPGTLIFNSVIKGLTTLGRMYEAVLLLEEMISQEKLPDLDVWNSLVSKACVVHD